MLKKANRIVSVVLTLMLIFTSASAVFAESGTETVYYAETEESVTADSMGSEEMQMESEEEQSAEVVVPQDTAMKAGTETTYTVKWMNGSTVLETDANVSAGSAPSYDGAAPVKPSDSQYIYTFAGWALADGSESGSQVSNLPPVSSDVTYYAAFSKEAVVHTHSWSAWTTTVRPTPFSTGTMVRTCSCGAKETAPIAKLTGRKNWVIEGGLKYYFGKNGKPYTGWHKIKPYKSKKTKWCYFSQAGVYTKSVKKTTKNKWVNAGGYKFYFSKKKKPLGKGFHTVRKSLYYMNSFGAVMIGTFRASDGKTYTTASNGAINGLDYLKHKYKTFVLVDISDQTLWYYKNGKKVIKTDVVTGTRGAHDTPTGHFSIRSKQRNIDLTGPTWNSHVNYWMAFLGGSYGLHDANWRSSAQFSNHRTYISNGSHGCVNMRPSVAAKLYANISIGTKVIVQQ